MRANILHPAPVFEMKLSEILTQFPLEHVNFGDTADHHEPTATATSGRALSETKGITRPDVPQHAQPRSQSQWVWSSTRTFENTLLDGPYNEDTFETSSDISDDAADDFEIIVGPSEHAARPYDLNQLGALNLRTQGWEPIRSTKSVLYFTDVIRLTEAHIPTRPLSFGSVLHLNGLAECRPCSFERTNHGCKKKWLCDFCHMHTQVQTREMIVTFQRLLSGSY